ncbi:hypothetical protein BJ944DRAFT_253317 [Cunninghamella echinulata]|nr:hypothetical protein BJ944DRAFT_253317 [Cunninghamella echinulata]
MEDIQLQVKELQSKIIQNTHLREKAIQLRPLLTDKNAQLQCDTQIKESKKYIDYFTEELNKLTYKITRASQLSLSPSSPITTTTTLPSPSDNINNNNNHDIIRPLSTLELTAQLPFYHHNNLSYQRFSTSSDFLSSPSPITPSSPSSNPFYFSYNHLLSTMEENSLAYNNTNIDDNKNNSLASPVSPLVVAPFSANGINSKKKYTNLDLLKSDTPINRSKVSLKLHELEYKVNIEKKVQKGIKNLSKTFNQSSPPGSEKRLKSEIKEKQAESKEKMALLTSAMKKYKDLYIGEESMDDLDEMDSLDEEEEDNDQDDKNVNGVNRGK